MQKYGVLDLIVDLVRGLHENMGTEVSMADESVWIQVPNGLRQGCVLAQALFLLYLNIVMLCWRTRCAGLEMILYKCGRKLVGERSWAPMSSLVTELCFADDAVITASTLGRTSLKPPWSYKLLLSVV